MAGTPELDEKTGTETTGHEWDGIKELNTPLPRWWLYIFYATIVWAMGYWVVMPAWPLVNDYTHGIIDHSQRANVVAALQELKNQRAAEAKGLAGADLAAIERDPAMLQFALAEGKSVFGDNCAPCHGAGGQGARGYPNLNDDVWLWGGKLADISHTITVGVRSTSPVTRQSAMPAFGRDGIVKPAEVDDLTQYVLRLSGQAADGAAVGRAAKLFADNCAVCHGAQGKGDRTQGAPNLTDKEWLYDRSAAGIRDQIWNGHGGVMPTWGGKLDPATIKALTVYVHSLGGGE